MVPSASCYIERKWRRIWTKWGQSKNKTSFIPQCPRLAQSAAAEMPGDGWFCKPTLFDWQSMRPHGELHQPPQSGNEHWNLKIWHSLQLTGAQKPSKVCAELSLLGGSCSWRDMLTTTRAHMILNIRISEQLHTLQTLAKQRCNETETTVLTHISRSL